MADRRFDFRRLRREKEWGGGSGSSLWTITVGMRNGWVLGDEGVGVRGGGGRGENDRRSVP